jgi:hypothetical protein
MGADLIGYHFIGPCDLSAETLNNLATLYNTFAAAYREADNGENSDPADTVLKSMGCAGYTGFADTDAANLDHAISHFKDGAEFSAELRAVWGGTGRDVSYTVAEIGGIKVRAVFAGAETWGDEPDGYGYHVLRALVGIPGALEVAGIC